MQGETVLSTDVFDNNWKKRAEDIRDDDLLQMNTFGRMLVALSLARTDYYTKVAEKAVDNTVMVIFPSEAEQVAILSSLRAKLIQGELPTDQELKQIPLRSMIPNMRMTVLRHTDGITELRRRLEDVHKQYEIGYIIFVMLMPEDSKIQSTCFIGSLLTQVALTLEGERKLVCLGCGSQGCEKSPLKKCAGCQTALYCSKECQNKDWKQHRRSCKSNR